MTDDVLRLSGDDLPLIEFRRRAGKFLCPTAAGRRHPARVPAAIFHSSISAESVSLPLPPVIRCPRPPPHSSDGRTVTRIRQMTVPGRLPAAIDFRSTSGLLQAEQQRVDYELFEVATVLIDNSYLRI